jgi:6-phosphogluconolactonase (cycloisomerase 2 family)
MKLRWIGCACTLVAASACGQAFEGKDADIGAAEVEEVNSSAEALALDAHRGAVFTQTNDANGNHVIAFQRLRDGSLAQAGEYETGGLGTSNGLGSQGAVALSSDHRYLLAVNAGSNDVSLFRVNGASLQLLDREPSLGTRPVSVTEQAGVVYVLNTDNVSGFRIECHGALTPIAGAVQPLSASAAGPAQIQFSADGRHLVVAEKATNTLDTYAVSRTGVASGPETHPSAGTTPFGFDITSRGTVVVSEAATGSASSYGLSRTGWSVLSSVVVSGERAPCWLTITPDDHYAFVANAQSSSVSSYAIARNGQLSLYDAQAGSTGTGGRPLDLALDTRGDFLYVLDAGHHQVASFGVSDNAALEPLTPTDIDAPTMAGIAAY